jgi:hypothetical protein
MCATQGGFTFSRVLGAKLLFCPTLRIFGTLDIDVLCEFGCVAENRHMVGPDFDETKVHSDVLHRAVGQVHACVVLADSTEEWCVPGQERDLTATEGASDDLSSIAREKNLFWRDDFYAQVT